MFLKRVVLIGLLVMIQSCAFRFKEFEGKPDEDVVYNRIQELKKSERYILASEYAKKFKEHFPKSDKLEELDLFVADEYFNLSLWDNAESGYSNFIKDYPDSSKTPYARKQLEKTIYEHSRFHKHADLNVFLGAQLFSTGDLSAATEAPGPMSHISISYYFRPNHGVFISSQTHEFKAKGSEIPEASTRDDKDISVRLRSMGYVHRWKMSHKVNLVYGIGVGSEKISFIEKKTPNSGSTLGFNQFLTVDYCSFASKRNPCWNGLFPSIGIFHIYSPNGNLGSNNLNGNLIGLGFGLKI